MRILGAESFVSVGVEEIYCHAEMPPVCYGGAYGNENSCAFGSFDNPSTPRGAKVYVPVGCADKYRNTWGWNYFTNFIETADFPTGIERVAATTHTSKDSPLYDLAGKRVSHPVNGHLYIQKGKKYIYREK